MKSLKTSAVVLNADGTVFYEESHHWPKLDDNASAAFKGFMADSARMLNQRGGKYDGDKTATLSAVVDGVAQPDLVAKGVSLEEVVQFQRHAHQFGGMLLDMGDQHARNKRAERNQQHGGGKAGRGNQSGNEAGN